MNTINRNIQDFAGLITRLVESGGPVPNEYEYLNTRINELYDLTRKATTGHKLSDLVPYFGDAMSINTLQGFVSIKPHGYAGDFEIIDRIYVNWLSPYAHLRNWDKYFHWLDAPKAVVKRKLYFKQLIGETELLSKKTPSILNVVSGSTRDIKEYLDITPDSSIAFYCLEPDKRAILYARQSISHKNVHFINKNPFRFKNEMKYELVWSAGLFDYLDSKKFVYLLKKLFRMVESGGKLVIGNFSTKNLSQSHMALGEWFVHHRSEGELYELAKRADIDPGLTFVKKGSYSVNLYLIIKKSNNRDL